MIQYNTIYHNLTNTLYDLTQYNTIQQSIIQYNAQYTKRNNN